MQALRYAHALPGSGGSEFVLCSCLVSLSLCATRYLCLLLSLSSSLYVRVYIRATTCACACLSILVFLDVSVRACGYVLCVWCVCTSGSSLSSSSLCMYCVNVYRTNQCIAACIAVYLLCCVPASASIYLPFCYLRGFIFLRRRVLPAFSPFEVSSRASLSAVFPVCAFSLPVV